MFADLVPDMTRVHGSDHEDTLLARLNFAHFSALTGRAEEAVRLHLPIITALERALGPDDPSTLDARQSLAYCTGLAGDTAGAVRLYDDVLPDMLRVLGAGHPDLALAERERDDFACAERGAAPPG